MRRKASLYLSVAAIGGAVLLSAPSMQLRAQQGAPAGVSIGDSDLGGVVSGPSGPEAGVWVIAETTDLPTKFAKIVVTDDQGRYVLPELPKANYSVWVRGYGLVDSPKVATAPGKILNLTAVPAPSAAAAAEYYPAIYWYSMLKVPDKSEFPGTGPQGNGMPTNIRSQAQWLDVVKTNGCYTCHQLGNKATRTIPKEFADMKPEEAWARRIMSGQAQVQMANAMGRLDVPRALKLFADWTDRIAAGELPAAKPTRPQGAERNIVISVWDWSDPKAYLHDEISTDKRKPTVNAYGKIYGSTEDSTDFFPVLDPKAHAATAVKMPVRDPKTPTSKNNGMAPSPYWGEEVIWDSQASMHNPMMDEKGQVWFTSRVGQFANPDFCRKGSDHPSAKLTPIEQSTRHLSMYDPKTGKHHADPHLLPHAPSRVRGGCQQHAVDQRRRSAERRHRVAQPQNVRGDRRRSQVAGLVGHRSRHQRQRQARRGLCRAEPAGRSGQGQAHHRRALRHRHQSGRRYGVGIGADLPGLRHPRESGRKPAGARHWPRSTSHRCRATDRAAWTSTATASPGCRCRAGIWRASIGASARDRSTARPPPASIAPRGGRSIRSPVRNCRT